LNWLGPIDKTVKNPSFLFYWSKIGTTKEKMEKKKDKKEEIEAL
jgi:hypothetical protein